MYSARVSAKLKCPVRAKLKCPNYPSEDEVREAEIGFGDDERTQTGQRATLTNSVISTDLRSGIRGFLQQADCSWTAR